MAIEASHVERISASEPVVDTTPRNAVSSTATATAATTTVAPSPSVVQAAVQQVQTAIDTGPNPDFTLDYLSGLSVVTVRSNITGEVVFQIPDTQAVELARLVKDGSSLASLGFTTQA